MRKKQYEVIGLGTLSILLITLGGVTFSVLFGVTVLWMTYGLLSIKRLARSYNQRWLRCIASLYMWGMIAFVSSFVIIEGVLIFNMCQFKEVEQIERVDYIIVLGAGLKGEEVGNTLRTRLDEALEYYNQHEEVTIIVSGGQGEDEVISEAEAMRRYLIANGVAPEYIIKEDQSTTTVENIKYSKEILKQLGDQKEKVLIATNDYHLFRARFIAKVLGVESEGLAAISPPLVRMNYMIREYPTIMIDFSRLMIGE